MSERSLLGTRTSNHEVIKMETKAKINFDISFTGNFSFEGMKSNDEFLGSFYFNDKFVFSLNEILDSMSIDELNALEQRIAKKKKAREEDKK